jgi:NADPH:quinone reductase-like Zn-dependent oxidoreductase
VKALQIGKFDAVLDAVGKTPIDDLISLTTEPSQVLTVANFGAAASGARVTGGGPESQPMKALSEAAELLEQSKLVIKIQTFPFDRAAEAHQISQDGHARGKLVLLPD